MARFEMIVFDWDGTLMDSTGFIAFCIQAAARDLGLAAPSDEAASYIIGLGMQDAMRHALPGLTQERYGEMAERYRHHFLAHNLTLPLFPGITALVRDLGARSHLLAVATGKGRDGLNQAFKVTGIGDCFHGSRCADECFSKPHPQMLEELMDEFNISKASTLMIGDTTHDLLMAKNAGVAALAVSYGAHPRDLLMAEAPLQCVDSVDELAAWLRERLICEGASLAEGGTGVRFEVNTAEGRVPAFVVRFAGQVHAYLNRCGHVPVEIDWQKGRFFDAAGLYLVCATHGALYAPESGRCLGGRCNGKGLVSVPVEERDGGIYLIQSESE